MNVPFAFFRTRDELCNCRWVVPSTGHNTASHRFDDLGDDGAFINLYFLFVSSPYTLVPALLSVYYDHYHVLSISLTFSFLDQGVVGTRASGAGAMGAVCLARAPKTSSSSKV